MTAENKTMWYIVKHELIDTFEDQEIAEKQFQQLIEENQDDCAYTLESNLINDPVGY